MSVAQTRQILQLSLGTDTQKLIVASIAVASKCQVSFYSTVAIALNALVIPS